MRVLAVAVAIGLFAAAVWLFVHGPIGCGSTESGGTLYLNRLGTETPRASFCYAADCRLIAEQMSKAERATWYCR